MTSGHDLVPVHTPPDVEGVARVIGGAGGIRFQWEELDRGAQLVSDAAEELENAAGVIAGMEARVSATRMFAAGNLQAASATSFSSGAAAAEAIGVARHRILDGTSELRGTVDRIRWSRLAYEAADAAVRGLIGDFQAVTDSHGSVPPLIASPLTVTHTGTDTIHMDGTVDNLLVQVSHAADEPGNAFEILEVEGESGPTYVVVIPGSEGSEWEDPFSFYGIGEAKYGNSEYVHDAVLRALEEVGAEGSADVILMGYSQGGMHAMNLANSGSLPEKYSVELVVTAGSPVEREEAPAGTTFLHLAHTSDFVPHADLLPQEDRPNQVSVILDHQARLSEGEDFGLGPAHKISSYREGAQAVDMSSHPSLAPITAVLGTAVAGSTARRHVFQVTRPPLIGPQPAPAGAPR